MQFPSGFEHIVRENEPLSAHTWLRIGGAARFFGEPTSLDELESLTKACAAAKIPIRVLGGGSNLLVRESGFEGLVLSLSAPAFSHLSVEGNCVTSGGGTKLSHLVSHAVGAGLAGLEHLVGIPGTVGGALHENSATLNGDIGQRVKSSRVLTHQGDIITRDKSQLRFAHHTSSLDDLVIISTTFELEPADSKLLMQRMQTLWIVKRTHQPLLQSNAVIPFVDPDLCPAAQLIQEAGLAGAVEGRVSLHPTHHNFLIANAGATSNEVLALTSRVRDEIAKKTGVQLQLHLTVW